MTLVILAVLLSGIDPGPVAGLSGRVSDSAGHPLAGVRVEMVEVRRRTATDQQGRYTFASVPPGNHTVSFALIGYRPGVRRVSLASSDVTLDVAMTVSVLEIPPLQVTASTVATSALTSPQPVTLLAGEALRAAQRPTLGETVEQTAGLRNFSTGSGIGKPVIRGLTSNRVLVVADGVRLDSQQWGDEHGPNIETSDAERVEIIRGPASVLYGSDAIGGVINVVRRGLPDALGKPGFVGGSASAAWGTNRRSPDGLFALEGASGGFGFRGSLAGRSSDDIQTPAGPLTNSGYKSSGGSVASGLRGAWGSFGVEYAGRRERVEIHEDPAEEPGFTGYQRIADDRVRADLNLPLGGSNRLEVTGAWGRNNRREFEAEDNPAVALGLRSQNVLADARLHHVLGAWAGALGASGGHNEFQKYGEESLIPNSTASNVGLYLFEQREAGRWSLSFGMRYDYRRLEVEDDEVLGVTGQKRTWSSFTGNLGLLFHVSEPVALVFNAGRAYRAPSTFELFSNGVHEGTVRFERGDATLRNETSLNGDLALRVQTGAVRFEVGGFVNGVSDIIYPNPTGQTDPESGLQIFDYSQGDAVLHGVETSAEVHPSPRWHLRAGADFVRGQNTTTDQPLPFIPAFRVTYGARWEGAGGQGLFRAPYLDLGGETNAKQSRFDPDDFAPAGYTLASFGAGFRLGLGARPIDVDLAIRNLFDSEYTSFMSRYKLYAPDPGRNVTFRLTYSF